MEKRLLGADEKENTMETYKVVVQPKQHYQAKMSPDELQE